MSTEPHVALLKSVVQGGTLDAEQSAIVFGAIMHGKVSEGELAAFLTAQAMRKPTVPEIIGAARAMRGAMTTVKAPALAVDLCGTGGDGKGTLNISTAVSIVVAACGTGSGPAGGDVTVGNVSDLAVGSSRVASDSSCVVVRDSLGVYAMTLTCTHAGCNMANGVGGSQIFCSCHGSAFGLSGAVIAGPARQALDHLAVSVDASGVITVHTGQTVTADTRVTI